MDNKPETKYWPAGGKLLARITYNGAMVCIFKSPPTDEQGQAMASALNQSNELAALREELANEITLRRNHAARIHELSDQTKDLQPRLTAAEQRNAELERDAARYRWLRDINVGPATIDRLIFQTVADDCNPPYRDMKHGVDLDAAIDSQIKPTESGASE